MDADLAYRGQESLQQLFDLMRSLRGEPVKVTAVGESRAIRDYGRRHLRRRGHSQPLESIEGRIGKYASCTNFYVARTGLSRVVLFDYSVNPINWSTGEPQVEIAVG